MKSIYVTEFHYVLSDLLSNAQSKEDVAFIEETLTQYIKDMCKSKVESLED